ncbi:methyl-accepting chemotaxis protein [uncultured Treponema sp.]|uniref:methyl-accepting chemotaxis protein n=1 Tax=uncultured Treponema sp. TaxID=162155 RepID=UPI0025D15891|nr:methyl-accepting chemotaxis protein [uncultured Treponema sp.]
MSKVKSIVFNFFVLFFASFFSIAFVVAGSRILFNKDAKKILNQSARIKELEFSSNLDGELLLATKMAKSPLISHYMENPQDASLSKAAMEEILSYQDAFKGKNTFSIADTDLLYYSNGKYLYTLDKSDPANSWFTSCLAISEDYTFIVSYDTVLKKTMLWVNAVVRDETKKGIGLIGTGVDLSDFVNMMYNNLEKNRKMFFYNKNKEITGAENTQLLEDKAKIESQLPEMGKIDNFPVEKTFLCGKKGCYEIVPIPSVDWMMVIFLPYTMTVALSYAVAPLGAVLILLLLIAAAITLKRLVKPLLVLNDAVKNISAGNADLTKRLNSNSDAATIGLIKKIEKGFNAFIEKLQQIIITVKKSKEELFESLENLRRSIHKILNSIEEINQHIDGMESSVSEQSGFSNQTSDAVNQISEKISSLNKMILTQNQSIEEASSSVVQMIGNINSVNNSVAKLSDSFSALEASTTQGVKKQKEVNERISEIENQSKMLQDANLIISSIASQTNLLAMNAAIEAAHAGEAGKGFSVVADEIRKLSETSSEQSKTIGQQLTAIQESISNIVVTSGDSEKVLHSVANSIHNTDGLVQSIMQAMKEQECGSKQISDSLALLQSSSQEVRDASMQTEQKNESILEETKKLQNSSKTIKNRINEMAECARSITQEAETLGGLSDGVDRSLEKIGSEIDLFKV